MTDQQIVRYLELVDRRLHIMEHSGVDWRPGYAGEMERVNREIGELRPLVEQARGRAADTGGGHP